MVQAVTHYNDADMLAKISENLGAPMVRLGLNDIKTRYLYLRLSYNKKRLIIHKLLSLLTGRDQLRRNL